MATTYSRNRFNTPQAPWAAPPTPQPPGAPVYGNQFNPTYPGVDDGISAPNLTLPSTATTQWGSLQPAGQPAAGGGGGGGGGAVNTNFDWPQIPDPAGGQADYVWGYIKGILSGKNLPFGAKEIDIQKGQAKSAAENTFQQAKDELNTRAAATGFASSPAASRQILEARIGASQQYGKASANIAIEAATQNFNAKIAALNGAQQWIDSLRSYTAQMTGAWWQREQAMAQLEFMQNKLNQEMQFAYDQLAAQLLPG